MKYRVLITDDHPLARRAICSLLESEDDFDIVGEAESGEQAVTMCRELMPDLVLMDIQMPGMTGLEATRKIKQLNPQSKIVMLTVSDDVADLFAAIQNGAQGYLLKNMDPDDWIVYLRGLLDDNSEIARRMADRLFHQFRSASAQSVEETKPHVLSQREGEILMCVASGQSNRQIAEQLVITENTVKNHIKNILAKLSLDNRVQLTAYAIRHGLTHISQKQRRK